MPKNTEFVQESGTTLELSKPKDALQTVDSFFDSYAFGSTISETIFEAPSFFKDYFESILSLPFQLKNDFILEKELVSKGGIKTRMQIAKDRQQEIKKLAQSKLDLNEIDPADEGFAEPGRKHTVPKTKDPYSHLLIFGSAMIFFGILQEIFL